jgi:hypothetical protein
MSAMFVVLTMYAHTPTILSHDSLGGFILDFAMRECSRQLHALTAWNSGTFLGDRSNSSLSRVLRAASPRDVAVSLPGEASYSSSKAVKKILPASKIGSILVRDTPCGLRDHHSAPAAKIYIGPRNN